MLMVRKQSFFTEKKKKANGHSEKLSPKRKEYMLKITF